MEYTPAGVSPAKGMCLVRLAKVKDKTISGLHLPGSRRRQVVEGVLVSVGAEVPAETVACIGAEVMLHGHAQHQCKITWGGEEYAIFLAEDIMAKVEAFSE